MSLTFVMFLLQMFLVKLSELGTTAESANDTVGCLKSKSMFKIVTTFPIEDVEAH